MLKTEEHKSTYTTFTANIHAYFGSQLASTKLMIQDLNDMNLDDIEEMDIQ